MKPFILTPHTIRGLEKESLSWRVVTSSLTEITIHALSQTESEREPFNLQEYIMVLFDGIDAQYKLIEKLDTLIDFKKIFGPIVGTALEQFDAAALRAIIKYILIPVLVSIFNPNKLEKLHGE